MSHFYGVLSGQAGNATRCGSKNSGLNTIAASWSGSVRVHLFHDKETGEDRFIITQNPWQGAGIFSVIAQGIVGK